MSNHALMRLIDGHFTTSDKVIARCHLETHRGFLSKNLIQSHGCMSKECPFFERVNQEYWKSLDKARLKKKQNRLSRKQSIQALNDRDALIRRILESNGHIHVTAIREVYRNTLIISYIRDQFVELAPEIEVLRKKLGKNIKLQAIISPDYIVEQLIREPRRRTLFDEEKTPEGLRVQDV